jgi:hypothetical protein
MVSWLRKSFRTLGNHWNTCVLVHTVPSPAQGCNRPVAQPVMQLKENPQSANIRGGGAHEHPRNI